MKIKNPPMVEYDIKAMLVRLGKTKAELGKAFGVSYPTIHRWVETGRVAPHVAFACYGFEVKLLAKRKAELDFHNNSRKTGGHDAQS
jgi:DNA-binding XRE family transcriptional regulator